MKIKNTRIWDIAPTALHLLGIPIPSGYGRQGIFPIHLKKHSIKYEVPLPILDKKRLKLSREEQTRAYNKAIEGTGDPSLDTQNAFNEWILCRDAFCEDIKRRYSIDNQVCLNCSYFF